MKYLPILNKIKVEMAEFNLLNDFILSQKETYNIKLIKVLFISFVIIYYYR